MLRLLLNILLVSSLGESLSTASRHVNRRNDLNTRGEVNAQGQISRQFVEKECKIDRGKEKIIAAWNGARKLADAQTNAVPGYDYNIPHTQWLGKDWNSDGSWWKPWLENFRKVISENFTRLKAVYSDDGPKNDYVYFYCNDYENWCKETQYEWAARAWDKPGWWWWDDHYIQFCSGFWEAQTLDDVLKVKSSPESQKAMENYDWSRDGIMFHETWHWSPLVSKPQAVDHAYGSEDCWNLAKDQGSDKAYVNADSYTLDAVAILVHQHFKGPMSPIPEKMLKTIDEAAYNATKDLPKRTMKTKWLPDGPADWAKWQNAPDLPQDGKFPNFDQWEEITFDIWPNSPKVPLPSPVRGLQCLDNEFGAPKLSTQDGSSSVESAIKEFCKNRKDQTVQKGDVIYDRWDISGRSVPKRQSFWLSALPGPFDECKEGTISETDCVLVLTTAMASCDLDSPFTYGVKGQGEGCIEYDIQVSASIHEGDPPWAGKPVVKFPPPETLRSDLEPASLAGPQIVCSNETVEKAFTEDDVEAVIEEHCGNDLPFGDPKKSLGGFEDTTDKGSLKIATGLQERDGYFGPYKSEDRDYCKDFPREHKSPDDCRYAFRKILNEKMADHAFCITYYRCVGYMVVGGEFSDPLNVEGKARVNEPEAGGKSNLQKALAGFGL